jgi:hypothetical protein
MPRSNWINVTAKQEGATMKSDKARRGPVTDPTQKNAVQKALAIAQRKREALLAQAEKAKSSHNTASAAEAEAKTTEE